MKILIVDDEPSMRMGLKDNLEFEGYQVDKKLVVSSIFHPLVIIHVTYAPGLSQGIFGRDIAL